MGKRPRAYAKSHVFKLYAPYSEAGDWLGVRNVSFAEGERMCRLGEWSRVYDANNVLVGYEICRRAEWNAYVTRESPRSISVSEMVSYAIRRPSQTAGLNEEQRLTARDKRTNWPLPPEDYVERLEAKVEYFGQHRLVA
jgi:hypothetical protein